MQGSLVYTHLVLKDFESFLLNVVDIIIFYVPTYLAGISWSISVRFNLFAVVNDLFINNKYM